MRKATDSQLGNLVRATLTSVRLGELSDGELLTRFIAARDEGAFAELVRRLGPTVYGVCLRILRAAPDAEDAFQVVFLVLARKAARVRPPGRVAAWLHGVAVLAARKLLAARNRRQVRETGLSSAPEPAFQTTGPEPDLAAVLDEEIDRLPARYRLPLVLCEVRELTVARAAAELGWPVGTVASRLSRGRALLARRLKGRGVACGTALATTGAVASVAVADVPLRLVRVTVSAAATGAGCSAGAPQLLNEVLWTMVLNKIRIASLGIAATAAVALGGVGLFRPAVAAPVAAAAPVPKSAPTADDPLARLGVAGVAGLLKLEAVQKDVGLSDEQRKKLERVRADHAAKAAKGQKLQIPPGAFPNPAVPGGQPVDIVLGVCGVGGCGLGGPDPELDKAVSEVLTADQLRRVRQIALQAMGPAALLDRRVIRHLVLTAAQEDKIDAAIPPLVPRNVAVRIVVNGQEVNPAAEKAESGWEAVLAVLTPEQRTKWDALVGKMLPTAELMKANAPDLGALKNLLPNLPGLDPNVIPQPE